MAAKKRKRVDVQNAGVMPRAGYGQVLERITEQGFCPFCEEHLPKHHSQPVLFRNKGWIATRNAWPYEGSTHHFLLIARRHIEDATQASPAEWQQLGAAFKRLQKDHALRGASLFLRSGDTRYTGATVQHLHAQVVVGVARTKDSAPLHALIGFRTKRKK